MCRERERDTWIMRIAVTSTKVESILTRNQSPVTPKLAADQCNQDSALLSMEVVTDNYVWYGQQPTLFVQSEETCHAIEDIGPNMT